MKVFKTCNKLQLESLLSGEADANNCYIEIHAGAGGTEAQDWALLLQECTQDGLKKEVLVSY